MRLSFGAATDVGKVRAHNEDRYAVRDGLGLAVLADGMGGHQRGDVAAELAVQTMIERVQQANLIRWRPFQDRLRLLRLVGAAEHANRAVWRGDDRSDVFSMGTTLVAAWFKERRVCVINVGDSRAYRHRGGVMVQLTRDHSMVADYLAAGLIKPEDVTSFPYRNIINRGIGLRARVRVDSWSLDTQIGDRYLLCSDGLTDLIDDETIARVMVDGDEPGQTADRLVALALDAGGIDNVTAVVVHLLPEEA